MPAHVVWENRAYIAFLSIFPNTPGMTVVIPRQHEPSYVFEASDESIARLMKVAKRVALSLDAAFEDVGRTGVIFEGFGVDHLHVKLYPMHGTANMDTWKPIENSRAEFYETYPGYLSSHDAGRCEDEQLEKWVTLIRSALKKGRSKKD